MIRLANIQKVYQDGENRLNSVLAGVDMETGKGEFIAIRGASGSGKTTLLSILGTLLMPDGGSYRLNGVEMTAPGIDCSTVRNRQIGFVFQDHRLIPQYSVLENILLPVLATTSHASSNKVEYARQLMKLTGILNVAGQLPHTLSGGEASRTAVCRALIMKPLLLLADEPTGQLDAQNAQNIAQLLLDVNKSLHTTIVMVTHSSEISQAARRVLTLKEGKVVA